MVWSLVSSLLLYLKLPRIPSVILLHCSSLQFPLHFCAFLHLSISLCGFLVLSSLLLFSVFLLFPGYPGSHFSFPVLGFRISQVGIKFLHSMFLFLDTCFWFSEKHFQKMISREGLNHFRHQLTYLPLKQEPLPCSCYLDPSQGSQLHHHFSFIYCTYPWLTTVCTCGGPIPSTVTGHKSGSIKTVPVMCHTSCCHGLWAIDLVYWFLCLYN